MPSAIYQKAFHRANELQRKFGMTRQSLLAAYSSQNLSGINTERITRFFQSQGLTAKPYIVITADEIEPVNNALAECKIEGLKDYTIHPGGRFLPELDLCIAVRHPRFEDQNGTVFTERIIIHELAHGSTLFKGDKYYQYLSRTPISRQTLLI